MSNRNRWPLPDELDDEESDLLEDAADTIRDTVEGVQGQHRDRLMQWVSESVPTPAPVPKDRPATLEQDSFEKGGYTIPIYQTAQLTDANGRWPEYVITRSLAMALDDAKHNYTIKYGYEPVDAPTQNPYQEDPSVLEWFANDLDRPAAGHVNLLLTADDGGGVTGGNNCIAGVQSLVAGSDPMRAGTTPEASTQYAALHEVGHALGVPGDADENPYEDPTLTLGKAWVENGRWHKTLVCSTENGGQNKCNEPIAPRGDRPVVYHNRYSDCAIREFFTPEELAEQYSIEL